MSKLNTTLIPPPYAGMNTVAPPGELPNGTGPVVNNFLTGYPNKAVMRGPIINEKSLNLEEASGLKNPYVTGIWTMNSKMLIGVAPEAATEGKEYAPWWIAPYINGPSSEKYLAGTKVVQFDVETGTTNVATKTPPAGRGARIGEYVFGYTDSSATKQTVNGYGRPLTKLFKWNAAKTWESGASFEEVKEAPLAGQAVKSYLNRLWVLGSAFSESGKVIVEGKGSFAKESETVHLGNGTEVGTGKTVYDLYYRFAVGALVEGTGIPVGTTVVAKWIEYGEFGAILNFNITLSAKTTAKGEETKLTFKSGGTIEPDTLTWSILGGPVNNKPSDWRDESSGLFNKIIIGENEQNDYGVGLAVVGQTLIIFKRHSIWALIGYSPETFQVRNITRERGCIDPWSICEVDSGVYFLSQNGVEFYDGSEFHNIDQPVSNITQTLSKFLCGEVNERADVTKVLGRCSINYIGDDYALVSFSQADAKTHAPIVSEGTSVWTALLYVPTNTWSALSSTAVGSFQLGFRAGGVPYVFNGKQAYQINYVTNPRGAELKGFAQVDINSESKKFAIKSKYITDRINLSTPPYKCIMHRVFQDYRFPNAATDATATENAWRIRLMGETAFKVLYEKILPGQGYLNYQDPIYGPGLGNSEFMSGRRWSEDKMDEMIDVRVIVENSQTGETTVEPKQAEIYNTGIEFQITGERHTV